MSQVLGKLTVVEFEDKDHDIAAKIARREGFGESYTYTSTSEAMSGMYLVPTRQGQRPKVVIKTLEFGILLVQDLEDMGMK